MAAKSAEAHDKLSRLISFKGTLQTMTAFQDALRWAVPPDREYLVSEMLRAIAHHAVGDRPGGVEPRAEQAPTEMSETSHGTPTSGAQTLAAGGLRDIRVSFYTRPRFPPPPLLWRGEIPVRDEKWLERVNEPLSTGDLQRLRHSVSRGRPFGGEPWTRETAILLGLESCLRPLGRPWKEKS